MNNKYSNFLTILLIIIIIAIVSIIGFLGFKYYETNSNRNNSEKFVDTFLDQTQNNKDNNTSVLPPTDDNMFSGVDDNENGDSGNSSNTTGNRPKYNGFLTAGTIEIPATNLKSPILDQSEYTKKKALDTAPIVLYGPGLNQVGITTISGHNYRNGALFSNNKKLNKGDRIFITDLTGKRLSYTIYDKFEADDNYADYMIKDTQGAIEIALSTCTDNSKARLIILARADV